MSVIKYVELNWRRPFEIIEVESALTTMAEARPRGPVVFEVRSQYGQDIKYLLGAEPKYLPKIERVFKAHGNVSFKELGESNIMKHRPHPTSARLLKVSKPSLSLNTEILVGMLRSGLSSLTHLHTAGSSAVIQIVFGAAYPPRGIGSEIPDPNASWLDVVLGNVKKASSEQVKALRQKAGQYSYDAIIRIGATGTYQEGTLNSLVGVFRTMSSAGVRITSAKVDPADITWLKLPWRMPLRLSVTELATCMLLPVGEEEYPGIGGVHPLKLDPPAWYHSPDKPWLDRSFAVAGSSNLDSKTAILTEPRLSISPKDSLEHTVILGPTGAGKSTVMLNLIMADINAGRSVMVIDPKADLVNDVLARIPEHRLKDVVVIDPADDNAVGWNPLEADQSPELVADAILAVFREIFSENWGIRAQENLSATLLTLAGRHGSTKDATLMWLPALLTDENFRKRIVRDVKDEVALKPFWKQYDAMKESERRAVIESSLNKVRQIIFRPGLRNILGQAHPKFQLSQLFTERKIVLVPLNKGLIGADSARLLGSLLVGLTWTNVLTRANLPANKRHIVSMYIDELQDYVSLPNSFADSLAQARGLGLAITVAHQYRAQLDSNLREGIDANCRNKIIFGLSSSDASSLAHQTGELQPIDFMSLPRYHIYTNFMANGNATGWISGITLPAKDPLRLPAEAKGLSQQKYGRPSKEVEAEIINALYPPQSDAEEASASKGFGNSTSLDPSGNAQQIKELEAEKKGDEKLVGFRKAKKGGSDVNSDDNS